MGSGQSKRRRGNGNRSGNGNRISMKLSDQLRREEKNSRPVGDSDEMDRCYSFSSSDSSDMSSLCHLSDEEELEREKSPSKEELPKRKEKKNGTPPPPPLPKKELPKRKEKNSRPIGDSDEVDRCYSFSSSDSSDTSSLCHLSDEEELEPEKSLPKEELPKQKEKKNGTPPPPPKKELPKRKEKNGTPPPAPPPKKGGAMLESDRGGGSSKGETPKRNGKTVRFTAEEKGKGKVMTSPERRGNVRSDVGREEEEYAFEEPRAGRNGYPCGPMHHCGCQENNWDNHDSEDDMAEILAQATYFFNDQNPHSNCHIM